MCSGGKRSLNKRHLWYFLFRKFLPLATQWAAVTTHLSDTRDPPQKCRFSRMRHRLTCHGFEPAKTFFPPTILPRPWGGIMGRPQTNRRKVKFAKEFNLGDAVSLRCKISPRILSGCDELKVIVNLRSRLFFSGRKGKKDIEKTHAHERPGRGGFLSNSRVHLAWCSLKTNKKPNGTWRWLFLPQINKQINTDYITRFFRVR